MQIKFFMLAMALAVKHSELQPVGHVANQASTQVDARPSVTWYEYVII
jgi:hypothetical protein